MTSLASHKHLFDVWLSEYFGNKKAQDIANEHSKAITDNDYKQLNKSDVAAIDAAIPLAAHKRFFHWQLEFPEVFLDETEYKENAGFDAVIGNPPYVSAPTMVANMPVERRVLEKQFALLTMKWDLYCAFMEISYQRTKYSGSVGLIVPSQVLYQDYAKLIRQELVDKYQLRFVADFSKVRVFAEAMVMTCILIVSKVKKAQLDNLVNIIMPEAKAMNYSSEPLALSKHIQVPQSAFRRVQDTTFRMESFDLATVNLSKKVDKDTYNLGDICYGSVGVVPHSEKEGMQKEHYILLQA